MGNHPEDHRSLGSAVSRFPPVESKKVDAIFCPITGCVGRTADKKPYCLEHLARMPYVSRLMAELETMTHAEILGPVDPYAEKPPRTRRRTVIPVEVQVGDTRFWIGLVRSRGVEREPAPTPSEGRRVLGTQHVRLRPFTRLLSRSQSRLVLLLLQEKRAEKIPSGWLVQDARLIAEVLKHYASATPKKGKGKA